MNIQIYDFEVTAYDWLVVFQDYETGEFTVFHNDNEGVVNFVNDDTIYIGFNTKDYDQFIMKAVCGGCDPDEIKELNDYLIHGGRGWEHPLMQQIRYWFNNVDIRDDTQQGLSLKAIEGHLGMSVQESTVDFNIDHPLTDAELEEMIFYCKHDVEATRELVKTRKSYLQNKLHLGRIVNLDDAKALSMTNAKLTAAYLGARKPNKEWEDERQYQYPENLKREYIPQEVFDFFDRMKDPEIPDETLFKGKLKLDVYGCPTTIGFGGIHGAIPFYQEEEAGDRIIRNYDVASYYPHLMTICGYTSRNIPDPKIYADMLEERMRAKKSGDKATANALKLVANTTYGAQLNQYNDLYDPLKARSVCISGQLYLLEMTRRLCQECETLRVVQLNTDGIMVSFDRKEYDRVLEITGEWQERTGFELEEDKVSRIYQKDVNNYVEIAEDGSVKIKGGYVVRGIAPAGAFNINNNAVIVAEAIKEYFVNRTDPEETINGCEDIAKFQMIAKAGQKYREAYHIVDGEKQPVQRVNRVYATADERYGKLFKVKAEDDSNAKIEMLPEHCIIDNTAINDPNHTKVADIDKNFYIAMARKRINDFLGIKPEKKGRKTTMATRKTTAPAEPEQASVETKGMNLFQKLSLARKLFADEGVKKSGMNSKLEFMYYELTDIVPVATPIFERVGILPIVRLDKEIASMSLVNAENPEQVIDFTIPMAAWEGNRGVNPLQVMGATVTYYRRYLYMIALDICERDEIDSKEGIPDELPQTPVEPPAPAPKPPATAEERAEVKKELTAPEGNADELQIKQLKKAMRTLKDKAKKTIFEKPTEEWLAAVAVQTDGFKSLSKTYCAKFMEKVAEKMEEIESAG